jgi:hypothetical protein
MKGAQRGHAPTPRSDVETAVLGHGDDLGQFSEGGGLKLERDPRFPVRVTVQFYKATSNGVVTAAELASAKQQIDRVYAQADFVGSLVVPEGERTRPTDWHLGVTQPAPVLTKRVTLPPTRDDALLDDPTTVPTTAVAVAVGVDRPSLLTRVARWLFD